MDYLEQVKDTSRRKKFRAAARSIAWSRANPFKVRASIYQVQIKKIFPQLFELTDITTKELAVWLEKNWNQPCKYCGEPSTKIDCILPLPHGAYIWDNIHLICSWCYVWKSKMTEEEYLNKLLNIAERIGGKIV